LHQQSPMLMRKDRPISLPVLKKEGVYSFVENRC
jgi:hypothetical protein